MLFVCRRQMSLCRGFDRVRQEVRPHEYDRRGNQDGNKLFDEGPECTTFIASCHDLGVTKLIRHIFEGAMQFFFFCQVTGPSHILHERNFLAFFERGKYPDVGLQSSSAFRHDQDSFPSAMTFSPSRWSKLLIDFVSERALRFQVHRLTCGKSENSGAARSPGIFCGLSVGKMISVITLEAWTLPSLSPANRVRCGTWGFGLFKTHADIGLTIDSFTSISDNAERIAEFDAAGTPMRQSAIAWRLGLLTSW